STARIVASCTTALALTPSDQICNLRHTQELNDDVRSPPDRYHCTCFSRRDRGGRLPQEGTAAGARAAPAAGTRSDTGTAAAPAPARARSGAAAAAADRRRDVRAKERRGAHQRARRRVLRP